MEKIIEDKEDKDERQQDAVELAQITAGPKKKMNYKSSSQTQQLGQAIEAMVQDSNQKAFPNFTRGPEIEITTRQDVEHLKALLS